MFVGLLCRLNDCLPPMFALGVTDFVNPTLEHLKITLPRIPNLMAIQTSQTVS